MGSVDFFMTHGRIEWRALVNTVLDVRLPQQRRDQFTDYLKLLKGDSFQKSLVKYSLHRRIFQLTFQVLMESILCYTTMFCTWGSISETSKYLFELHYLEEMGNKLNSPINFLCRLQESAEKPRR